MSLRPPLSLAILISGRGSNMAAIADACRAGRLHARIAGVIADRDEAAGLALARERGLVCSSVPARNWPERAGFEAALISAIDATGADVVVLAGFMRVLSAAFVQHYMGRLLNIHPSLLPAYKGLHTHRRVLAAGEREHGVSVHFVTPELDGGPVIMQARVPVQADDTEASLSARVQRLEHRIYPAVIALLADGRLRLDNGQVLLDARALATPLQAPALEEEPHAQAHPHDFA